MDVPLHEDYRFYVYAYLRKDGSPYYIGKGTGDRAFRNGGRLVRKPKNDRIIFLQTNLKEEDAYRLEKGYIKLYGRKTDEGPRIGILRNISDGGQGFSSKEATNAVKKQFEEGRHSSQVPGYMKSLAKKQFEDGKHPSQVPGHMKKLVDMQFENNTHPSQIYRGENSTSVKLKEREVITIFWDKRSYNTIGKLYGISKTSVGKIKKAEKWKHITLELLEQKKRLISV